MGVANITFTGAGMLSGPSNQTASLRTGIIANLLNPNPYLFWLTVGGPIMLRAGRRSTALAGLFLFCFYGCLVGSKIVLAAVVGHTRQFLKSRAYVWIIRSLGILLMVFAGLFFLEGLKYLGWL
jgi:threonine/homoserine/homoserine lactone efflux protein